MLAAIAPGYWFFAIALVIIGVPALTFTNTTQAQDHCAGCPTGALHPDRGPRL